MNSDEKSLDERFLVLAPLGADALNIARVLNQGSLTTQQCKDVPELCRHLGDGAATIVLTEEALKPPDWGTLATSLEQQPPWSDIPIVVIAGGRTMDWWAQSAGTRLGQRANLSLLERPLRSSALLASSRSALRARRRQYELRALMAEREAILQSLETQVTERTAKLQDTVTELESFSYSVSHDLRAPLRIIAGYARTIMDDHESTLVPDVKHYVRRIAESAERMDQLTRDLLRYTRVSRSDVLSEKVDLESLVTDLTQQSPVLAAAGPAISITRPLESVRGHALSLVQALSSLLENSLKFVPPERKPCVNISTARDGDSVRIVISDNGVGIPPEHRQRIFGIFERVAPKSVPGTGMGLAIVKRAVERMGGTVGVDSIVGTGSQFWILLPAA